MVVHQIIGRIQHFITRKAMDIEGLGGEMVALLYKADLAKNYADLYELKKRRYCCFGSNGRKVNDNFN